MTSETEEVDNKQESNKILLLKNYVGEECGVFRIPPLLLQTKPDAFVPQVVSIGPYHNKLSSVLMIQHQKTRFLDLFLETSNINGRSITLRSLETLVGSLEESIRSSYSQPLDLSREKLVNMMVVDGCFILMLVLTMAGIVERINPDDAIFKLPWILPYIRSDLLLLENQVPNTLLEALFAELKLEDHISLSRLICFFFKYSFQDMSEEVIERVGNSKPRHILHLIRDTFIPSSSLETSEKRSCIKHETKFLLSAKKLKLQGIKFKPKSNAETIIDIGLENHTLLIPHVILDRFKGTFFLNCVAFEQCGEEFGNYITSYVIFMGFLLKDKEDASFMCEEKIVENCFGDNEEVSHLFMEIGKGAVFALSCSYLAPVFERINAYTSKRSTGIWADFKRLYC